MVSTGFRVDPPKKKMAIKIPKTGNLFKFREDYLTTQAQMQFYDENDP